MFLHISKQPVKKKPAEAEKRKDDRGNEDENSEYFDVSEKEEQEAKGKPDGEQAPDEEDKAEDQDDVEEEKEDGKGKAPVARGYSVLYYKKTNHIGIRQKLYAKSQIFSFGGKACGKSERQLRDIVGEVVLKLQDGLLSEEAHTWANEQV